MRAIAFALVLAATSFTGFVAGAAAAGDAAPQAPPMSEPTDGRAAPIRPFRGEYEVWRNGSKIGAAVMELSELGGGRWHFNYAVHGTSGLAALAAADVNEDSEFRWAEGRPELLRYDYKQSIAFSKKHRSLVRSADGERIAADDGKKQAEIASEPGVIDRNVLVLALAADMARGAADFRYRVADKRTVGDQEYSRDGRETVSVPAGRYDAERMKRIRKNADRTTTSWLAPELGYLPARMEQREPEGDTIELKLVKLTRR